MPTNENLTKIMGTNPSLEAESMAMPKTEEFGYNEYKITLAPRSTHKEWTETRSLSWERVVSLMTKHQVGPKDGPCFTPAVFRGKRRTNYEASEIGLLVLDCDSGDELEDIRSSLQRMGWKAVIYSTHSHGVSETKISYAAWEKSGYFCPEKYLIEVKGLKEKVAVGAKIEVEKDPTIITIKHNPCPKFRVVIPLERPWIANMFPSQAQANDAWKASVLAVSRILGLNHDSSCTDTARFYYLPRHSLENPPVCEVVEGAPCDFPLVVSRDNGNTHTKNKTRAGNPLPAAIDAAKVLRDLNLKEWAAQEGRTFDIVAALKRRKPEIFTGYVADGHKHHIQCVNMSEHSTQEVDNATFIVSPEKSETMGFVYHCRHAHCQEYDRLFFVARMLDQGWLIAEDMYPDGFPVSFDEFIRKISSFDKNTHPDEIQDKIEEMVRRNFDPVRMDMAINTLTFRTKLTKASLKQSLAIARRNHAQDVPYFVAEKTLARYFLDGEHLLYAEDANFWEFTGKCWKPLRSEQLRKLILKVIEDTETEKVSYATIMKQAEELLQSRQAVEGDFFHLIGDMPSVINCQNGELWLQDDGSVQLKPHNPKTYLTYVLDVDYDSDATCPRFDKALLDTFANSTEPEEMARHVQEIMGYAIQPSRFISCWFMWQGEGENGKTKLAETLQNLMSASAVYCDRIDSLEKNRFAIGNLVGKLLLKDDDVDTGTKLPDGIMKKLSERKLLSGEKKFKSSFEFVSSVLILLLANNYPVSADLTHGMRRRAKIVPFRRQFKDVDRDDGLYPYIWNSEMAGVLNRLIEGLQRLKARGEFLEPADCKEAQREWLCYANPLPAFVEECCLPGQGEKASLRELHGAFCRWIEQSKMNYKVSPQRLRQNLRNLGYGEERVDKAWWIIGISIINYVIDPKDQF